MSSQIYQTLPGLAFGVKRSYVWKTGVQEALSGKQSAISYRQYPLVSYELTYSVFNRTNTPDEFQSIVGLYNQMKGRYDTFLFTDPDFNTITAAQAAQYGTFGIGDGYTTAFQLIATLQNSGGPGGAEIIQNLNGSPQIYENRWGGPELLQGALRTNYALQSTLGTGWSANSITITASAGTSPDGFAHATEITDTTSNAPHAITQGGIAISGGSAYTFSVWLKYVNHQYCGILMDDGGSNGVGVDVDLINGVLSTSTFSLGTGWVSKGATITAFSNGWYRVSVSTQAPAFATTARIDIQFTQNLTTNPWSNVYSGTGSDAILCWGAQLELSDAQFVPTALIPTTTSSATNGGSDLSLGSTGIVTFVTAPASGVSLSWAGSWYYRCRFDEDAIVWTKFMANYWKAVIKMTSVKL